MAVSPLVREAQSTYAGGEAFQIFPLSPFTNAETGGSDGGTLRLFSFQIGTGHNGKSCSSDQDQKTKHLGGCDGPTK